MNCPICGKPLKNYYLDYISEGLVCEKSGVCEDEYHSYEFVYLFGNTLEAIDDNLFRWYYNNSEEENFLTDSEYNSFLKEKINIYQKLIQKEEV